MGNLISLEEFRKFGSFHSQKLKSIGYDIEDVDAILKQIHRERYSLREMRRFAISVLSLGVPLDELLGWMSCVVRLSAVHNAAYLEQIGNSFLNIRAKGAITTYEDHALRRWGITIRHPTFAHTREIILGKKK